MKGVVCSTKREAEEGSGGAEEGRVQCVKFAQPLQKSRTRNLPIDNSGGEGRNNRLKDRLKELHLWFLIQSRMK